MKGWQIILMSLGWVLIIESLGPLIAPQRWREAVQQLLSWPNATLQRTAIMIALTGIASVVGVLSLSTP